MNKCKFKSKRSCCNVSYIFRHGNSRSGGLGSHHLFKYSSFCVSFRFTNIYLRLRSFSTICLFSYGVDRAVGLVHGEIGVFEPSASGFGERVLGLGDYFTRVGLGLNDIGSGADHVGGGNQGLQAREARVLPTVAKGEFVGVGHFGLETGVVLRPRGPAHGFGVIDEPGFKPDAGGGRSGLSEVICFDGVELLIKSVIVIIFSFSIFIFSNFGSYDMGGGSVVIIFISDVIVGSHGLLA